MQLVIDSATAACSVALIEGGRVLEERHEVVGRGHAERLAPMIEELLAGRKPASILVDCGPGSFTGVRVGLAAAHGLAIGWQVPLAGYSSMAALAAEAGRKPDVAVALHGGHGQLFVQSYGTHPIQPLDDLRSLYPEEAAAAVTARVVVGTGAEDLVRLRGYGEAVDALPRASIAARLPAAMTSLPPRPIYGRGADAKPMM
ncbi:MAG TPA: tRNA (adenosine(37)-N6)-threonylcarbamoyltransferase complex dimerization subunit type 1 TsaB [Allosphingosinicella sp.]|uniref:tRNA (adenosine(37)-N6)-threonylcarbamoyltransferase complex dimerization subunit type 1 TsaB n=1 Tax=Allosphingosinicella sp. TaxID=2823234 RepID=UPI002ED8FCF0